MKTYSNPESACCLIDTSSKTADDVTGEWWRMTSNQRNMKLLSSNVLYQVISQSLLSCEGEVIFFIISWAEPSSYLNCVTMAIWIDSYLSIVQAIHEWAYQWTERNLNVASFTLIIEIFHRLHGKPVITIQTNILQNTVVVVAVAAI